MIAKESSLILDNFYILKSDCTFIPEKKASKNLYENVKKYPVDIDFDVQEINEKGIFFIFVNVKINHEEEVKEGYSLSIEGVGRFTLKNHNNMSKENISSLINSGISICVTSIRAYLANLTSYYPLGSFYFHSIDMNELIEAKIKSTQTKS